ncbi:MAG: lamin tail domain-containing protein [Kofleriaceae bacterium]|nr:lamin tail domain-containing protein [Kofleriaceae bacterium]
MGTVMTNRLTLLAAPLTLGVALAAGCGPDAPADSCKGILPGDLVISEVFSDYAAPAGQSGADAGQEWFEIYNASGGAIDAKGLTLIHSRPDGSKAEQHVVTAGAIGSNSYFVLGNVDPDLAPAWVNYGYGTELGEMFNTGGGKLTLTCGTTEVDVAQYDMVKSGRAREFDGSVLPEYQANDDLARWCEASGNEFSQGNFGSPGEKSDCIPVLAGVCNDNGTMRATVAPMPGELVITEVMPSPGAVSDTVGEWVEIEAKADVDLNGISLDRVGDSTAADVLTAPDCLRLAAGSRAVFAKSSDAAMNGMLPSVVGTFKFSMVAGSVASPGDVQILAGNTVIDAITWTKSTSGKSLAVDPAAADAASNDDESNFCNGTVTYGLGDFGTPGAINTACNAVPVGMCNDAGVPRASVKPGSGQLVITEFMASPAGTDGDKEWFEIKNTGATAFDLNGLTLNRTSPATSNIITSADCKSVAAGGYALFAHKTDAALNDMLPAVDATFTFALPGAGDIRVLDGATVLDAITWTTAVNDASSALDPDFTDVTGNDIAANFCLGSAPYGALTNKGTPKAANAQCP